LGSTKGFLAEPLSAKQIERSAACVFELLIVSTVPASLRNEHRPCRGKPDAAPAPMKAAWARPPLVNEAFPEGPEPVAAAAPPPRSALPHPDDTVRVNVSWATIVELDTLNPCDTPLVAPRLSVTVKVTVYDPDDAYVWLAVGPDAVGEPLLGKFGWVDQLAGSVQAPLAGSNHEASFAAKMRDAGKIEVAAASESALTECLVDRRHCGV